MSDINDIYEKILNKAINFLSYRIRSEKEVSDRIDRYLAKLKLEDTQKGEIKTKVFGMLVDSGLVNDEDFVTAYINQVKNKSKRQISFFLYKKGISKDLIQTHLEEIDEDSEMETINTLADKRLKRLAGTDKLTAKSKLIKYLISKGFPFDKIYTVVDTKFKVK